MRACVSTCCIRYIRTSPPAAPRRRRRLLAQEKETQSSVEESERFGESWLEALLPLPDTHVCVYALLLGWNRLTSDTGEWASSKQELRVLLHLKTCSTTSTLKGESVIKSHAHNHSVEVSRLTHMLDL